MRKPGSVLFPLNFARAAVHSLGLKNKQRIKGYNATGKGGTKSRETFVLEVEANCTVYFWVGLKCWHISDMTSIKYLFYWSVVRYQYLMSVAGLFPSKLLYDPEPHRHTDTNSRLVVVLPQSTWSRAQIQNKVNLLLPSQLRFIDEQSYIIAVFLLK